MGGILPTSQVQDTPRLSRPARTGISLGFTSDAMKGIAQAAVSLGTMNVSIPQFFTAILPLGCYISPFSGESMRKDPFQFSSGDALEKSAPRFSFDGVPRRNTSRLLDPRYPAM